MTAKTRRARFSEFTSTNDSVARSFLRWVEAHIGRVDRSVAFHNSDPARSLTLKPKPGSERGTGGKTVNRKRVNLTLSNMPFNKESHKRTAEKR
jgi:hypothetical protein